MQGEIVQTPPTSGKVIVKTTMGELEIELWCKEAPKACKNFIQLCLEGYYDGTEFFRLIPHFMLQGGDPTNTGEGGESIYGGTFDDEYHQRLRFQSRGIIAMATNKKNENRSQFFITLDACSWLDNKHTIFGRVTGNSIHALLSVNSLDTDGEDRPLPPQKFISANVVLNPFEDIVVRNQPKAIQPTQTTAQAPAPVRKIKKQNRSLLSFEEEVEEENIVSNQGVLSSHDALNDPKLKKQNVITKEELEEKRRKKEQEEQKLIQLKEKMKNANTADPIQDENKEKKKVRKNVDISSYLDEVDKDLVNFKKLKNEKGYTEIAFEKESDSSSSSSSESQYENEQQKAVRDKQIQQYQTLRAELIQFKQYNLGTYNEQRNEMVNHEKKLLSNVEKRRLKYLNDKKEQRHQDDINQRLDNFRKKLFSNEVQTDRMNWMNHKLKFHTDSVTAFAVHDTKERVQDFQDNYKKGNDTREPIKFKSNVSELLKLSE